MTITSRLTVNFTNRYWCSFGGVLQFRLRQIHTVTIGEIDQSDAIASSLDTSEKLKQFRNSLLATLIAYKSSIPCLRSRNAAIYIVSNAFQFTFRTAKTAIPIVFEVIADPTMGSAFSQRASL